MPFSRPAAIASLVIIPLICSLHTDWRGGRSSAQLEYTPSGSFAALSVADVDTSVAWYERMLAFDRVGGSEMESGARIRMIQRGSAVIELVEVPEARPFEERLPALAKRYHVHGIWKIGFDVDDFDGLHAHLVEQGAEFYGKVVTTDAGQRLFVALDPDGNRLQIYEGLAKRE